MHSVIVLIQLLAHLYVWKAEASYPAGHTTGCGCTTTTTCAPADDNQSCPPSIGRPGKQGPKGRKGEPSQVETEMQGRIEQLERDVQEIKTLQDAQLAYLPDCASYHSRGISDENLQRVPLHFEKSGELTTVLANCTRLPEIRGTPTFPYIIPLPRNSLLGRTLILDGTPSKPNAFRVNFRADTPTRYFFHLAVKLHIPVVIRNSYDNDRWERHEANPPGRIPFEYGVPFQMKIKIDEVGFHVTLDGEHLFTREHSVTPLIDINRIEITGHLVVSRLSFN